MNCGERIKAARKKAGLTQSELAERIGIKPQVISQYERGVKKNPKPATLKKIANALGDGTKWYELYSDDAQEQGAIIASYFINDVKAVDAIRSIVSLESIKKLYHRLNTDGKLLASDYLIDRLDEREYKAVTAYLQQLVDTPQYQKSETPPGDGEEGEKR